MPTTTEEVTTQAETTVKTTPEPLVTTTIQETTTERATTVKEPSTTAEATTTIGITTSAEATTRVETTTEAKTTVQPIISTSVEGESSLDSAGSPETTEVSSTKGITTSTSAPSTTPTSLPFDGHFITQEAVLEAISDLPAETKREIGFTASDMIRDCQFNGMKCRLK